MTAKDLALQATEDAGYQLEQALAGLSGDQWTTKVSGQSMSPVETLTHLTECYKAFVAIAQGQSFDWGSYQPAATDPQGLMEEFRQARGEAVRTLEGLDTEKALKDSLAYIVLHDAYHVGQLCNLRLSLDPEWDAYSIYRA